MPRYKIDNWKEMSVQKIGNAFKNHFFKTIFSIVTIFIIIIFSVGVVLSGWSIKTRKGTTFHKEPVLLDGQIKK